MIALSEGRGAGDGFAADIGQTVVLVRIIKHSVTGNVRGAVAFLHDKNASNP